MSSFDIKTSSPYSPQRSAATSINRSTSPLGVKNTASVDNTSLGNGGVPHSYYQEGANNLFASMMAFPVIPAAGIAIGLGSVAYRNTVGQHNSYERLPEHKASYQGVMAELGKYAKANTLGDVGRFVKEDWNKAVVLSNHSKSAYNTQTSHNIQQHRERYNAGVEMGKKLWGKLTKKDS